MEEEKKKKKKKAVGRSRLRYLSKWTETQQLTVIERWKLWLATVGVGKLPTNQKFEEGGREGGEEEEEEEEEEGGGGGGEVEEEEGGGGR